MLLRTIAVLAALLGCAPAFAAGTIPLSLSQQFDTLGKPLSGCKLYSYAAGTSTPQNAFVDQALTIAMPWPMTCDASGRLPQFFYADGLVKVRLTDKYGVQVLAADGLLVVGPSSGGGGGGAVDQNAILQTGDLKVRYGTGTVAGWVRANGRTIGSASSGATERANSDTQALWEYLCNTDNNLKATISGGYSGNCANDYASNKTIQVPDWRGMAIAGMDDMGNTAAGRLTASYFGASTTLGTGSGQETNSVTIQQFNLPNFTFTSSGGSASLKTDVLIPSGSIFSPPGGSPQQLPSSNTYGTATGGLGINISFPTVSCGPGCTATPIVTSRLPPMRIATIYIRL